VAGAVLAELSAHGLAWCEVAPTAAKRALTGRGDAKKLQMLQSAAPHFNQDALFLEFAERRGLWADYFLKQDALATLRSRVSARLDTLS
jgi:hypothetical protein